ncbi:MAG: hypothetical protein HYR85_17410 [Planctomycetes bacterium]|nr:hypothetical protein [Planctomycetota bacterium]MBI3843440.1 hypothetical protein [Planctomycetota bacterium]
MIVSVLACAAHFAVPEPIVVSVPKSSVQISIPLEEFEDGSAIGNRVLLAGTIPPKGTQITVLALSDGVDHTSAEWRELREREHEKGLKRLPIANSGFRVRIGPLEKFDVDDAECDERWLEPDDASAPTGSKCVDYHAYIVAARYCFEIHVSWTTSGDSLAFTRDDLARIVRSIRVGIFRKGSFKDYPSEVVDFVDRAVRRMPGELQWISVEAAKRNDDYVPYFVLGELGLVAKDAATAVKGYRRAVALLAKSSKPSLRETWVWMRAEQGLGLALTQTRRLREGAAHYLEARRLASELNHPDLAGLAYVLALTYAADDDPSNAATYLKEAIALDPGFRDEARNNDLIKKLADNKAIQPLLATPQKKN